MTKALPNESVDQLILRSIRTILKIPIVEIISTLRRHFRPLHQKAEE